MRRRALATGGALLATGGALLAAAGLARAAPLPVQHARDHRLLLHVGGADPALMATALHNILNAAGQYDEAGKSVAVELVANGAGFAMLRADTSPVRALIAEVHERFPLVVLSACQASRRAFEAAEGHPIPQVPEATDVPFGIVRIVELQEQGWSYVRA